MPDPTTKRSPEQRAIDYAESIGVNEVYADARAAEGALTQAQANLVATRNNVRVLEDRMGDREMELWTEHRSSFDSQSAFDKGIKTIVNEDEQWRDIRKQLRAEQAQRDLAETDVHAADQAVRISTARMTEFGGLLSFLGAVKVQVVNNANQAEGESST